MIVIVQLVPIVLEIQPLLVNARVVRMMMVVRQIVNLVYTHVLPVQVIQHVLHAKPHLTEFLTLIAAVNHPIMKIPPSVPVIKIIYKLFNKLI